jgi:alpha-amylase
MSSVCLYFQVHQPYRLRHYSVFDSAARYFDAAENRRIACKVAQKCYLPATRLLCDLCRKYKGKFRLALSITGTALEQLERCAPPAAEAFAQLAATGCVEFLAETYHHSLSLMFSEAEFRAQVELHRKMLADRFNAQPRAFRNTELIYDNDVARVAADLGFAAVVTESTKAVLGRRTPGHVYRAADAPIKLLLRNHQLSDAISFRFSDHTWSEYPLMADKFARWIKQSESSGPLVNLFMDYETFGEHQWAQTGIFDFLAALPRFVLEGGNEFLTPSQCIERYKPSAALDVPHAISWADTERDLSAWLGNAMQTSAMQELYRLEQPIKVGGNAKLLEDWRRMTASDHVYYMSTKRLADGNVHQYFSPYESPYDAYINFMNVLDNLRARAKQAAAGGSARSMQPKDNQRSQ